VGANGGGARHCASLRDIHDPQRAGSNSVAGPSRRQAHAIGDSLMAKREFRLTICEMRAGDVPVPRKNLMMKPLRKTSL
jgi:hypothetical protein